MIGDGNRFDDMPQVFHVAETVANKLQNLKAFPVKAIDTTAAGDTFIGALAAALCEGVSLDEAVALGQSAAAICVTRRGAQTSIPYRRQVLPSTPGVNYP